MNIKILYKIFPFFITFVIIYIFYGTGIHSDEITEIDYIIKNKLDWFDYIKIIPQAYAGTVYFRLFEYYLFYWPYLLSEVGIYFIDALKIIFFIISVSFVSIFLKDYIDKKFAILFALLFYFYPSHDSSVFWYELIGYNTFACSLLMLSHSLIRANKFLIGIPLSFFSGFFSYSTLPYIFGLSIIFLYEKKFYKFFLYILIGILYLFYYLYLSYYIFPTETKISSGLGISSFLGNLILNLVSSIDALVGISFFYKIYLSIMNISFLSLILSIILTFFMYFFFKDLKISKNKNLIKIFLCFITIYLVSILMYSLTGQYFQTPFNLGNRVTIYGSLLGSLIFIILFRKNILIFLLIFNLYLFGISDHWKNWNNQQNKIFSIIENNKDLKKIDSNNILIIKGNLYSKLGSMNHIEFFIQPWLVETIFKKYTETNYLFILSDHLKYKNNEIIDIKYSKKIPITKKIYLYDSNSDLLSELTIHELIKIINSYKKDKRHIIQIINIDFINKIIIKLNPRLEYIFSS